MPSDAIWNIFLKVRTAKKVLKARMLSGAFLRGLKQKEKILIVFHMSILKYLKSRTINGTSWRYIKRYFGIADVNISVAELIVLKTRTLSGAFWRYVKRSFGNEDGKIIVVFKCQIWFFWKKYAKLCILVSFKTAEKVLKTKTLDSAFWCCLKRNFGTTLL